MEELTIKREEIEDGEFFLDVKVEEDLLQEGEICQEVTANYKQEFDREIQIEEHGFLEDSNCDMSDYTYLKDDDDAQSYPICEKIKSVKQEVEYLDIEEKKIKSIQCTVARNNINKLKSLVLDIRSKMNRFKCSLCDYSSSFRSNMAMHVRAVHGKEKPFICSKCDYSSARESSITMHVKAVHDKEKTFKCSECDYSSARKSNMAIHVRAVHGKEKPFNPFVPDGYCNSRCVFWSVGKKVVDGMSV